MFVNYPFNTTTKAAVATNGTVTGIAIPALNRHKLENNTAQLIIYNSDGTNILYIVAYNDQVDAAGGKAIANCIPVGPGAYLTLSLGVRSERVGTPQICGITTAAGSFDFTITEIFNIEE